MSANAHTTVLLQPRDPLIARDARPFDPTPGARATTLAWPWPQTVAGALRTHAGNAIDLDWSVHENLIRIHEMSLKGPLLVAWQDTERAWQPYIPAPSDAVVYSENPELPPGQRNLKVMRLSPRSLAGGEGVDLPYPGDLQPLAVDQDVKPEHGVAFWSIDDAWRWLLSAGDEAPPVQWLGPLPQETRMHVALDEASGTASEGALFATTGLRFPDSATTGDYPATAMLARLSGLPDGWDPRPGFVPLGGERRLTAIEPVPDGLWPAAPEMPDANVRRLRLMLVTPGVFERGWLPGWLDRRTLEGAPPSAPGLKLKLVSAALGRRMAISGWRLRDGERGQRPTRYAAPPGAVYFFDVVNGPVTAEQWRGLWLESIADLGLDRDNGYGLALPGIW